MKNLLAFLLLVICCFCFTSESQARTRLIAGLSEYPPYYYTDSKGAWKGMSLEVLKRVVKKSGYTLYVETVPWSRAMNYIKLGRIDLMLNVTQTAERARFMDFIGPCSYEQMVLIVKKENINLKVSSLNDLSRYSEKKFGLQHDYYYPQISDRLKTDESFRQNFDISVNSETNIRKTLVGRILGFFDDKFFALYASKIDPSYSGLAVHSFSLNKPQPVFIASSQKTEITIRNDLRKTYLLLEKSGEISDIIENWLK